MYEERLGRHRAEIERLTQRERAIGFGRLGAFVLIVVFVLLRWNWAAAVAAIAFVALVVGSEPVKTAKRRAAAAAAFCERGLARLRHEWQGKGDAGSDFAEEHHPFAADLDLFGSGSLFELMSIAATASGRATLASWLKHPERMTAADVRARQASVAALREKVELREDLFVEASEVSGEIEAAHLEEWASEPALLLHGRFLVLVLGVFGAVALVLAVLALFTLLPKIWALPFLFALVFRALLQRRLLEPVQRVIGAVERREPALALLARLLARLEREDFWHAPPGSARIEKLRRLVALLDARRNQFFAPVAAIVLWSELLAFAIERWRRESGRDIVAWIDAVGETEALLSLASFAYENPSYATPEIVEGDALFDAVAAAHPLIPADRRVPNDVRLGVLIVSGSNMSGKSTLMRTVGINAVLALAGAPVCARSLRVTPMSIGASIRIHDSLAEGASRFYAEILRIRQIVEMQPPLLFLLDELLHGTNSHDRAIGAEAIVRGLVERGAIGLATTHDLALAQVAEALAPRAANVHFEDHMEGDAIVFDYKMRPGVVTKSNALALMKAVGIID
ncbi:MAG TPA: DNA mismatch repair protein MutS [Thermoanaerobaculia bacterium]|nr:DNA mismatch repair protein MutS [Thermoanaerobaculia bacterium]